jgi:hypothetical protein
MKDIYSPDDFVRLWKEGSITFEALWAEMERRAMARLGLTEEEFYKDEVMEVVKELSSTHPEWPWISQLQ